MSDRADQTSARLSLPRPRRLCLALLAVIHSLVFGLSSWFLPWPDFSFFSVATGVLAVCYLLLAVLAALDRSGLRSLWRVTSLLSLVFALWLVASVSYSALYVAELYGGLGRGIAAAMAGAMGTGVLCTVPVAVWGLVECGLPGLRSRRSSLGAIALLGLVVAGGCMHARQSARGSATPMADLSVEALEAALATTLEAESAVDDDGAEAWLDDAAPRLETVHRFPLSYVAGIRCERPPGSEDTTILAVAGGVRTSAEPSVSLCAQGTHEQALQKLADWAKTVRTHRPGAAIKVDVVRGVQELPTTGGLVGALSLRPGLDGICFDDTCLAPWQLVVRDQFRAEKPIPPIHDLLLGVDVRKLRFQAGRTIPPKQGRAPTREQLMAGARRIAVESFTLDPAGRLRRFRRMKEPVREVNAKNLRWAMRAAEAHIARAQNKQGMFRYTLNPATGKQNYVARNLPRQAGTTLVGCELAEDRGRAREVAQRSLTWMASFETDAGPHSALVSSPTTSKASLGSTALPLISFLACRELVGAQFDPLIGRLANFLLAMQRGDGGFHPKMSLASGRALAGPEPLYAGGQAVYALTLVEKVLMDGAIEGWPEHGQVRDAVEAAMNYTAGPYWSHPMANFFYIEENWHCLAARASLGHHRNDGYEQFCRDYMAYKRCLILDDDSAVQFDFKGGYGFGNVVAPHNTGSSGFLEGLAADLALARARGEDTEEDRELVLRVLGFLLRQQWNPDNCLTCRAGVPVIGGFSESMNAPVIRIDFVQHAWASMGHSAKLYDLLNDSAQKEKSGV